MSFLLSPIHPDHLNLLSHKHNYYPLDILSKRCHEGRWQLWAFALPNIPEFLSKWTTACIFLSFHQMLLHESNNCCSASCRSTLPEKLFHKIPLLLFVRIGVHISHG